MPTRIPHVVIAITAQILKIVAEQAGEDPVDARIVEQAREVLALVDKGHDARSCGTIVRFAVVAATEFFPHRLESLDHRIDSVVEQPWKTQIAKGFYKGQLLRTKH